MAYENGYRLWDEEYEQAHWTPEELAASNARVARIGEIINAEHNGEISHDEAMIRHLMLDPDLLEVMLDDAYGDTEQVKRVRTWGREAKVRTQNLGYWKDIVDNAEKTVEAGQNSDVIIRLVSEALSILKATTPAGTPA
mgnify:CR=1 FL=1